MLSACLFHLLMPGITDHEANIVFLGEFDCRHNILACGHVDRVIDVIAQQARAVLCSERVTALIGEICLHHRGG